jgi:hypothetical protein
MLSRSQFRLFIATLCAPGSLFIADIWSFEICFFALILIYSLMSEYIEIDITETLWNGSILPSEVSAKEGTFASLSRCKYLTVSIFVVISSNK